MSRPLLSVDWPAGALKPSGFQDFGAQDLKTETTRITLCGFDQSVQCLGVGVAHGMIEIGKDRFMAVSKGWKAVSRWGGIQAFST